MAGQKIHYLLIVYLLYNCLGVRIGFLALETPRYKFSATSDDLWPLIYFLSAPYDM